MDINDYKGEYISKRANHMYIAPIKELQDLIAHYTITFPSNQTLECETLHILPDASGCLIFKGQDLDYWGAMSEIVLQKNDLKEEAERFFVEFLPGGLYQISGQHQREFVNKRQDFNKFNDKLKKEMQAIYLSANNYEELIRSFNEYFIEKRKNHPIPEHFLNVLIAIDEHKGNISMQKTAQIYNASQRKLLRDFRKYIGLSGKEYANIVRINHLLKNIGSDLLTMTAVHSGFFDQSHFNKLFKQITKTTPTKYLANLSAFYNEFYKF